MINVSVKDYCQNCPMFTPKVDQIYMNDKVHTTISCEYEFKCSIVADHIREELKKEQNHD